MKIWIKYLIACVLGVIAGIVLPTENVVIQKAISVITDFSIHFGRWTLIPTLFFSMTSNAELTLQKKFCRAVSKKGAGYTRLRLDGTTVAIRIKEFGFIA